MKSLILTSHLFCVCSLNIVLFCPYVEALTVHRIVGGNEISIESCPYIAQLRLSGRHFCGGSIISLNLVLTAAHCMQMVLNHPKSDLSVVVGETTTITPNNNSYEVSNIWRHSLFHSPALYENDVALIKIKETFVISSTVQIIPLNIDEIPCGVMATVSGWGRTKQILGKQNLHLKHLKAADIPIVCIEDCKAAYQDEIRYHINDKKICIGFESGGIDACQGDSGGPVVYEGKLIGIVSYGIGCADKRYPGVNTKVSAFIDWIQQFMD